MKTEDHERLIWKRGQEICDEQGYTFYTRFSNGRDACIANFIFTHAILADLTEWGHGERWCYHSVWDAMEALAAWDGYGEPHGWHRHPETGRRREGGDPATEEVRL